MNYSKISVRYAKAIFLTAKEKDLLDIIKSDFETINNTMRDNHELPEILSSPVIKPNRKKEIINQIFDKTLHKITMSFINMVLTNKREEHLTGIFRVFNLMYKKEKNIKTATLTTSSTLSIDLENKIKSIITEKYNCNIEFIRLVKPEIIGGFLIQVDDELIDASVSSKLQKIKDILISERI